MIAAAASGALLAVAGALLLYAGSTHQRLSPRVGRHAVALSFGGLCLAASLPLLLLWAGPATAVFIWLTIAMAVWSIVPVAVAWARRERAARP